MKKVAVIVLFVVVCCGVKAQPPFQVDSVKLKHYLQIIDEIEYVEPEEAFIYIDSIYMLGNEYQWRAKLERARQHLLLGDLHLSNRLLDTCVEYYTATNNNQLLVRCYSHKAHVAEELYRIPSMIEYLNLTFELVIELSDSIGIAELGLRLAHTHMDYLEDPVKALSYLKKSMPVALNYKHSPLVFDISEAMMNCYLLVGDTSKAVEYLNLTLELSNGFAPLNPDRYIANSVAASFFLDISQPEKALEQGQIMMEKGEVLGNSLLLIDGSAILTEAYLDMGEIDLAYKHSKVNLLWGEKLTKEGDLPDRYIHELHWEICEAKGLIEEAFESFKIFHEQEMLLVDESTMVTNTRLLYQGELDRKEVEKEKVSLSLELTKANLKFKSSLLIGGTVFLLLVVLYVITLLRNKRKGTILNKELIASNEMVKAQKEELVKYIKELELGLKVKELEGDSIYFTQSAVEIRFEDILFLESSNNYVLIHVNERKNPLLERVRMKDLIEGFPTSIFVRVHRSHHVNTNHIVSRPAKHRIIMSNKSEIKVSRSYVDNLGDKFL
ncbi:MAG: LytTR family transcriptional regulator [Flavobacteriales bacterium]|nr:LytTR family transcriptional regulator [Flavobacteriales bacterium]